MVFKTQLICQSLNGNSTSICSIIVPPGLLTGSLASMIVYEPLQISLDINIIGVCKMGDIE